MVKALTNSRANRAFADALFRSIAVSILSGCAFSVWDELPFWASPLHGGARFVPVCGRLTKKLILEVGAAIERGCGMAFRGMGDLRRCLKSAFGLSDCQVCEAVAGAFPTR